MKKYFLIILAILLTPFFVEGITLIEPSLAGNPGDTASAAESYIGTFFNIGLGLIGVLSVLMIIIGGFQYILSAASPSEKEEGKKRISGAVIGLLLAAVSFTILNTINPALLKFDLKIGGVTGQRPVINNNANINIHCFEIASGKFYTKDTEVCFLTLEACQEERASLLSQGVTMGSAGCTEASEENRVASTIDTTFNSQQECRNRALTINLETHTITKNCVLETAKEIVRYRLTSVPK